LTVLKLHVFCYLNITCISDYENKEEKSSKRSNKRDGMKKCRIIRGYTQEELAKELGIGGPQVHYYEQKKNTLLSEVARKAAEILSVDAKDLILKSTGENCCEDEDNEGEKELLSWARVKKINNQESQNELDVWVGFLSQRRQRKD